MPVTKGAINNTQVLAKPRLAFIHSSQLPFKRIFILQPIFRPFDKKIDNKTR
jgi:hypothetical protein